MCMSIHIHRLVSYLVSVKIFSVFIPAYTFGMLMRGPQFIPPEIAC